MKNRFDIDDALVVIGGAMVAAGIWFIYWPAALIIIGLAFAFLGIRGSKLHRSK